ncbi:histidine--tRNA ligase [Thermosulfuriphilus ammonigenes]|uniref:Histidine--tRNA ligase n=1 Tax=Thermosulfuriphilus ammonigenes TaxID=1936021 RepID=A0A6G7PXI1_9BACT|nr:histidine--tRNA ligase [Thermosulfuriphilus ammonigenes]MBA2849751.1 histidyl-tRNA synthetase [Thermosulfuriphilus ammonigenes]QIJ72158.1 histidine--tRNA ligase [Thermosulfuriphilus ammonigenes]
MPFVAIRGFKDILPGEAARWAWVEAQARQCLGAYNFQEIRIPVLEKTELFARSIGTSTDIVEKEMYSFQDRSGESVTMRPEATAGIIRAIVEHRLFRPGRVLKLFTIGPMFRYERPQKGRLRQFHQIDVEVIGAAEATVDAEVISLAIDLLKTLKVSEVDLELNSLGCPKCRPNFREALVAFLHRQENLCPDCRRRRETNPLRVLDCKNKDCQAIYGEAPLIGEYLCPECEEHFQKVKISLEGLNIPYRVNPRLVRGLDYYTRTTFEIIARGLGAQNAVAAGGRYDGLMAELGGPQAPAIGFAIGLERLMLLAKIPERIEPPPLLFFAPLGEEATRRCLQLAREFRLRGIQTEIDHAPRSLKAKMRQANRIGARLVVIIGDNELVSGKAIVRDMETHEQQELPFTLDGLWPFIAKIQETLHREERCKT